MAQSAAAPAANATSMADLDALFAAPATTPVVTTPAATAPAATAPAATAPAATSTALDQAFATPPPTTAAAPMPTAATAALEGASFGAGAGGAPGVDAAAAARLKQQQADAAAAKKMLEGADVWTGAPVPLRAEVGAAPTDADRLAAVRKWYPDAQPVPGTNNFVYTDPTNGRKTSFQAVGLPWYEPSLGGMAALGGDVASAVGGTAGGLLGGAGGTAIGGPGVGTAIGSAAGFGVGSAAGREIYRRALPWMGLDVTDTRTPGQVAGDVALETGINTALPLAGRYVAGPLLSELLKPGVGTAVQQAADALDITGVTSKLADKLPAGVASQSRPVQIAEGATLKTIGGGATRDAYDATDKELTAGAQNVAQQASGSVVPPTPSTFASRAGEIAQNVYDRFNTARETVDNQATNLIGANRSVDIAPLRNLRDTMLNAIDRGAPQSDYQAALDRLDQIIDAANRQTTNPGYLDYNTVRAWRTNVGKDAGFAGPPSASVPATGVPAMQNLYGTINGTLGDAATAAGPTARAAFDLYNNMVSTFRGTTADTVNDLINPATRSNRLVLMARSTAPADQQGLVSLLNSPYLTADQKGELTGGFINQLGSKSTSGAPGSEVFDMPTWLQNYRNMTPLAKGTLFGGSGAPTRDALDQLATVQGEIGQAGAYRNPSGTAYTGQVLTTVGLAANAAASGQLGHAAAILGGGFGGPYAMARVMQSAPFVRWLTSTYGLSPTATNAWSEHLARLGGIAANDPTIAPFINDLKARLTAGGEPGQTQPAGQ